MRGKVLKLRNNFYFYFSIGATFFIFILVFSLYEMEYKLSNFLDTKTILQVMGTLGGAYYGAKIAGKYSVNVMQEQHRMQKVAEQKKEKVRENRKNLFIHLSVKTFINHVDSILMLSEKEENEGYRLSMEESINEMSKVIHIFDNMDYLDIEEELMTKYMTTQIYLKGLLSTTNNLRKMHEAFAELNKNSHVKTNRSELNQYLDEVTPIIIETRNELQETLKEIQCYIPSNKIEDI